MIDIRFVRENPNVVHESQRRHGNNEAPVDALLVIGEARRSVLQAFETARASRKGLSRSIGKTSPEECPIVLVKTKTLAERVRELETAADGAEQECLQANATIWNIVLEGVPTGGEEDYEVLKHVGESCVFDFESEDHLGIVEALSAIDMTRGMKIFDPHFYYLKSAGAWPELALLTIAVGQVETAGFMMMTTSTFTNPGIMAGTGSLGVYPDEIYYLSTDDQYLMGTSEVAPAGYHKDEIVGLSNGPLCYAGWSSRYRRRTGPYDKGMRRIIHVHQLNRVKMPSYCRPEEAEEEHRRSLAWGEKIFAKVELPYRVISTAAGGLDSPVAQKFDCEAWLPTQSRFVEITSTSDYTTFQTRRFRIRGRFDGRTRTAATLNGTLVITYWLAALPKSHQRPNGSLYIPETLRPYLSGHESSEPVA